MANADNYSTGSGWFYDSKGNRVNIVDVLGTMQRKQYTALKQKEIAVPPTGETISNANPDRQAMIIQNDSDTPIYLNFGNDAPQVGRGIRINANGGSFELNYADGGLYIGKITAIHAGEGTKNVMIVEV